MDSHTQNLGDHPFGPVRLSDLDSQGQRDMRALIAVGTQFAAEIVGFDKGEPVARLGEAIGERLADGTACEGLEIDDLCEKRTSSGRVRESLVEPVRDVIDIAVRAILARSRRAAIHEWVASQSVQAGTESNAIGVDRHPNVGTRAHVLLDALGTSDRQLVVQGEWLKTGTRDDHACMRADRERIARWEQELGGVIPGPFHEHLGKLFEREDQAEASVRAASEEKKQVFVKHQIDPNRFLDNYFPDCLIIGSIPHGPPAKRGAASGGVLAPGDDEDTVVTVEDGGRYGVARCGLGKSKVDLGSLDDALIPELTERFSEIPEPVAQSRLDRIASWSVARDLRIVEDLGLVRYWWFKKARRLLRSRQVSDPDGAEMLEVHLWRAIRLDDKLLHAAIALIERAHQPWTYSCIARFCREAQPGLAQTWKAVPREGLLRASLIPNAAGVCAYRMMEDRRLGR